MARYATAEERAEIRRREAEARAAYERGELGFAEYRRQADTGRPVREEVWAILAQQGLGHKKGQEKPTNADIWAAYEEAGLEWTWVASEISYTPEEARALEAIEDSQTEQESEQTTDEQPKQKSKKKATKKSKKEENKEDTNMTANNKVGARANRVVVRTEGTGYVAEFFKTHKSIAVVFSEDTGWKRDKDHNPTQARESFRTWVQANSSEFGVAWIPELQAQAWNRKYWKYETDSQVEEDAIELMGWTIRSICEKVGLEVTIDNITLDSIVPMESPLSYVENGKYTKNGNWAVAQVNLEVKATIEGSEIDIIYPIEMRSGQLTKIKLTKGEIEAMVADSKVA